MTTTTNDKPTFDERQERREVVRDVADHGIPADADNDDIRAILRAVCWLLESTAVQAENVTAPALASLALWFAELSGRDPAVLHEIVTGRMEITK